MLYFCAILGASDPLVDDSMVTDMAVAAALVESSSTRAQIFTTTPFRTFSCCSGNRFIFGDSKADRLEVPVPEDSLVVVNSNGTSLKSIFLQEIATLTTRMPPQDQLIIFIAAHGEEEGEVLIGEQPLRIAEIAAAVKNNAKTVLLSTTCFSGKWLQGDVPRQGYVAAPSDEESASLVASDSNYNRGRTSMLTTFASLAADQNIEVPLPYRSLLESAKPHQEPTPIQDTVRPLQDLADDANERRKDLTWPHEAGTIADPSTQRSLPVPLLISEVLNRFKLVRYYPSTSTPKTTKSVSFRSRVEHLPPIPGLSVHEFVEYGIKLLDAEVSSAHLVYLAGCLQKTNLTPEDVRVLFSAFDHRRQCQLAIETYLDWVGWRSKRPPRWDFSGGGGALERIMLEHAAEAAAAWQAFFCWRPEATGWRNLSWTDIRQQLALAWEGAGPPFSATQFLAVAGTMDDIKKVDLLISSPSLQPVVQPPTLDLTSLNITRCT
ncbi:hypothetical protein GGX14DRAFT_627526 [Mycena pura]|uniref:Uncharacterized protein n=1 Tax=Mycena pura TaxID=153505 RepID=A0AAD6YR72_9AGAR|nr:hypothetical protein GGX14DRAFT_627526 [Mycena pura]